MKKIEYIKALRDDEFEKSVGYYYKANNGTEYAIDYQTRNITELSSGLCVSFTGWKLDEQIKTIEERSESVKNLLQMDRVINIIKRIKEIKGV